MNGTLADAVGILTILALGGVMAASVATTANPDPPLDPAVAIPLMGVIGVVGHGARTYLRFQHTSHDDRHDSL